MSAIIEELREIRERLQRIEERLALEDEPVEERRAISNDVAHDEIAAYFEKHAGETLYYSDIADALNLPLEQVVAVCARLIDEGLVGSGER